MVWGGGPPYFARGDRYVRDLRNGAGDFKLAAYYIRNGGGKRNVAKETPILGRRVT